MIASQLCDAASETEQDSDDNNGDSDGNGNDEDQNSQLVRRVTDEANDSLGSGPRFPVRSQPPSSTGQVSSKRQRTIATVSGPPSEQPLNERPKRACSGRITGNYACVNWPSSSDEELQCLVFCCYCIFE